MVRAKELKEGNLYIKNGFVLWYKGGYYYANTFNYSGKASTLTALKLNIKQELKILLR
jgi:hypothetical protein